MSWPYIHTLVNHFPIILTIVGAITVLFAMMFQRRAVWEYALVTLTLAGATIYPAWASGHKATGALHAAKAWYIAPGAIHAHSSAAYLSLWIVGITGVIALISLVTLVRTREAISPARALRVLVGLGALLSIVSISYTGYLGGQIVVDSPILASPTPPVIAPPVVTPSVTPSTQPAPTAVSPSAANPAKPVSPTPQPQTP